LLFARLGRLFAEFLGEQLKIVAGWLAHFQAEHIGIDMLGRHLEMAADVVPGEFAHVVGAAAGEIHADAAGDEHPFDARRFAGFTHDLQQRRVIGSQ
jgi:hypothetical protein